MLIASTILAILVLGVTLVGVALLILMERKVAAYIQDRIGPNRVGPRGLFQPIADGLKLFFKEDLIPGGADRVLFVLAPALTMFAAMATLAIIPFGGVLTLPGWEREIPIQIAPGLDIGILFIVMISTCGVYGVVLGGWSSNSKYSFYGAIRAVAQMLSYEVPLGLTLLSVILLAGELRPEAIVERQLQHGWLVIYHPGVFLVMFVCILAEANRVPFDLPETEQELVGGYHTEYSSMKFAMFFMGEYAHIIAASALMVTLFFGGWHLPYLTPTVEGGIGQTILKLSIFAVKVFLMIFVFMWVRWTLPRFRFDQLLRLGWCALLPLAISLFCVTGVVVYFRRGNTLWMTAANLAVLASAYGFSYIKAYCGRKEAAGGA